MARLHVVINEQEYPELARWLEEQPNKSEVTRDALQRVMEGENLESLVRRIIREELAKVVVGAAPAAGEVEDADPQAAARLDQMF